MKIYSPFSDFYDGVEFIAPSSKNDPQDAIFQRISRSIDIPVLYQRQRQFRDARWGFDYRNSLISDIPLFFCGEFILIPRVNDKTFSSFEKALEYVNSIERNPRILEHTAKYVKRSVSKKEQIEKEYRDLIGIDSLDFYVRINAPYFLVEPFNSYRSDVVRLVLNPPLFEIGFAKIRDPYSTFQSIEMFFNTILINRNDKDAPQITDNKVICEAKGFDSKISFRKRKTG